MFKTTWAMHSSSSFCAFRNFLDVFVTKYVYITYICPILGKKLSLKLRSTNRSTTRAVVKTLYSFSTHAY